MREDYAWPIEPARHGWENGAAMNESEKQFSFTRRALSTCGRPKSKFLSPFTFKIPALAEWPPLVAEMKEWE